MVADTIQWQISRVARLTGVLFMAVLAISAGVHSAIATPEITLTSSNDSVYFGDTVVIEMEAVGVLDTVDISALSRDADLLRQTTGTRIAVIEERVVEVKLRRMEFLPRREGKIVFGPLHGETTTGRVSSLALTINVLPATDEQWEPSDDDLQMSITLSNSTTDVAKSLPYAAHIGERIIVDITLRHQHPIADENMSLPDFEGFDILTEYELRRTIDDSPESAEPTEKNHQPWRMTSWRYHLFAQRSGTLTIAPVVWSGLAIRSRTQRAEFHKQTEQLVLKIQPALPDINWWLPSPEVELSEQWSKDARELTAGDEVFRTITLTARDVLASHLPDVKMLESRAISSTLVEQARTQQLAGEHIEATATFRFRLVAQSPIPVFLDTVRVPWYDTSEHIERESIIPARRINIGLPDRADLLAELALNERWLDKAALDVRSFASRFAYWHVSLALLSMVACLLIFREIRLRRVSLHSGRGNTGLPEL